MEPLDPKAELIKLARDFADESWRDGRFLDHDGTSARCVEAEAKFTSAITLALAAERRRALENLATELEALNGYVMKDALCTIIRNKARLSVDGKAGGT